MPSSGHHRPSSAGVQVDADLSASAASAARLLPLLGDLLGASGDLLPTGSLASLPDDLDCFAAVFALAPRETRSLFDLVFTMVVRCVSAVGWQGVGGFLQWDLNPLSPTRIFAVVKWI